MQKFPFLLKPVFLGLLIVVIVCFDMAAAQKKQLRFGLTPVFLDDKPRIIKSLREYLEEHTGSEVEIIQRGSYKEIVDMLLGGELDAAWICGLPYVERKERMSLVAVPVYIGVPLYRSYLIVNKDDTATQSWKDLPKGVFAFSDRDSNSGWLYPQWAMQKAGIGVKTHFRKTFLAGAHRNVVEAVAEGLADAGSVDGYVWDTLNRDNPSLTTRTRIVEKSETFGFPPIVARNELPDEDKQALRKALIDMASDSEGRRLLDRLNLDGFVEVEPSLYDNIAEMSRSLGRIP